MQLLTQRYFSKYQAETKCDSAQGYVHSKVRWWKRPIVGPPWLRPSKGFSCCCYEAKNLSLTQHGIELRIQDFQKSTRQSSCCRSRDAYIYLTRKQSLFLSRAYPCTMNFFYVLFLHISSVILKDLPPRCLHSVIVTTSPPSPHLAKHRLCNF